MDTTEDGVEPRLTRLCLIAFGSGFAVMGMEIAGARVMAPVFGLSAVPWTAIIAVILSALALGSYAGGRLADSRKIPLSWILVLAAGTAMLPVIGRSIPSLTAQAMGFIPAALLSSALLFSVPVFAMGAVVPFLIRISASSLTTVGSRAGLISALATVGSITGTVSTGFVLIPFFTLRTLFIALTAIILVLAALAVRLEPKHAKGHMAAMWSGAASAMLLGAWLISQDPPFGEVYHQNTMYGSLVVVDRWLNNRPVREFQQNGGVSSAEYIDSGESLLSYVAFSAEMLGQSLRLRDSVLVLGGAALSLPVALTKAPLELNVDVVELDPGATDVATRFFSYGRLAPSGLRVIHADARRFLQATTTRYNAIYLDVFDHLASVPWTVVTHEALNAASARLQAGGLFMANVLSPLDGPNSAFLRRFLWTLQGTFGAVAAYAVETDRPAGLVQNVLVLAAQTSEALPRTKYPLVSISPAGPAFTDDFAPVEYLQARILARGLYWMSNHH